MIGAKSANQRSFFYGQKTITYNLFFNNRKTLEIAVHPDTAVVVRAPLDSEISLIERKILKRARWILKQIRYFQQFSPKTPERCYVNGETHLYLGKQFRLNVTQGQENSVKLTRGIFNVTCLEKPTPEIIKKMMQDWYLQKATSQFDKSLIRCFAKFDGLNLSMPPISIKRMQKRWGSLSKKGALTLNSDLIKAPWECIDYVVTHELCHLKHHDHSAKFYQLLDSLMPEWKKIKHKLELHMS